ncbi:antirestriction protein (plasmid) [Gemmobacter fulvus]|uniref:Antirestriction protein n=1 Tax=Gemmobacter fulvus TaxID=2840474 RepID=A0A975PBA2_9RHOB|nr:antirestriction protein [Gemmobacter fulvus]MBT9248139.1 antirestriction protein [Gemmobacter fulvus]QWK92807.1 antirestriction protein [Gemmobacter fulvus]
MAQFSVEITRLPGSVLGGNQQLCAFAGDHPEAGKIFKAID